MIKNFFSLIGLCLVFVGCGGSSSEVSIEDLQKKTFTDTDMTQIVASAVLGVVSSNSIVPTGVRVNEAEKYPYFDPNTDDITWGSDLGSGGCEFSGEKNQVFNGNDSTAFLPSGMLQKFVYGDAGATCTYLKAGYGDDVTGIKEHNPCDFNIYMQMISGVNYIASNETTYSDCEQQGGCGDLWHTYEALYYAYAGNITFRILAEKNGTTVQVGVDQTCEYNIRFISDDKYECSRHYEGTICGHDISELVTLNNKSCGSSEELKIDICQVVTGL